MNLSKEYKPAPEWTKRVPMRLISRLYRSDAAGTLDEELIDEVGFWIYSRCKSILAATEASRGRAECPICQNIIRHFCQKEEILYCKKCKWEGLWQTYLKSYQKKQLHAGGMEEYFKRYVLEFPNETSPRKKLFLIDWLIHRHHWDLTNAPTRPGAVNLIEGKMADVIAFLDDLTYNADPTEPFAQNRSQWRQNVERARKKWGE